MKRIFFLILILGLLTETSIGLAQINVGGSQSANPVNPGEQVSNFYLLALEAAGLLAFGYIVWGAIKYTLAAGNPSGQSDARDTIMQALWGLLLLMGAFLILRTINPNLVNLQIQSLQGVQSSQPSNAGGSPAGGQAGGNSGGTQPIFTGGGGKFGGGGASGTWEGP